MRRRDFLKAGGSLAIGYLGSALPTESQAAAPDTAANRYLISAIERIAGELMRETQVPGAAIALVRDGKPLWSYGFGVKEANTEDMVDADTLFEAASISKTVFAYAILKL